MSLIPFALVSGVDLNSLFSLATYALFFVFILYGQRIQYYVTLGSPTYTAVWDGALKNYGPNLGFDYGGRLIAAWLDR